MRSQFRSLLILLLLFCAGGGATSPAAHAQEISSQPWECPECPPEQIDRSTGGLRAKSSPGLPEQIQIMGRRMTGLMELLQNAVVRDFTDWAMSFSQILAGGLWLFFLLKVFRESGGKGDSLYWWFPRLGVCMGLLLSSIMLVNEMVDIGKGIAVGPTTNSSAFKFYDRMQANFNESYALIAQNQFKVRVPGQSEPYAVKPVSGDGMFLGVVYDQQSTARDLNNNLKDTTWLLPRLYAWLGVCRGLLEFADFVLMILAGVTIMAAKIFAPFAVVLAVDRDMAKRISYPFFYGVVVLTIVWPTVSYFIRGIAYMFGNVAMALGDSAPAYVWNEATMQAFRDASAQPVYTVAFACFTMAISAIALFFSPVIAYQISTGRLYEGITNAVSTAAGMVSGFVMEAATSIRASLLSQDAARIQAQAGFDSETTRAGGERQAADLAVKGRQIASESGVEGNRFAQLANAYASQRMQTGSINADKAYQLDSTKLQRNLTTGNQDAGWMRDLEENRISYMQQSKNLDADKFGAIADGAGGVLKAIPLAGEAGASVVGGAARFGGAVIRQDAADMAFDLRNKNTGDFRDWSNQNQDTFVEDMTPVIENRAREMTRVVNASTSQIVGGVNHSADVQLTGIRQDAELQLQANQTRYDAQTQAAGITRGAAIEAARLHTEEQITRAIGSKLARDIESAMTLRY
jgi:hypothetical protein